MRIALVGKGGSGKTTVSSLLLRYLIAQEKPVLAIDADINQHLAQAINWNVNSLPEVGNNLIKLKDILRGKNALISSANHMLKTTLPGPNSHFITLTGKDPILKIFAKQEGNAWFLRIGGFTEDDIGQRCFHAKTGGVELILNHLIDRPKETILVDMTAGADAFASGLFSRFDLTLIVVEPTLKSISVYKQYKEYAQNYPIAIRAVGNKVQDAEDLAFLQEHCGKDLLGNFSHSTWVKQTERGQTAAINTLEPKNLTLLQSILATATQYPRDWKSYWKAGIHFHNLNAKSWGNDAIGCDATAHINTEFLKSFRPEQVLTQAEPKVA